MPGLSSGDLDRDIVFQKAPIVRSDTGDVTYDWDHATCQTVAAKWVPASVQEGYLSQHRLESHVDGQFIVYDMDPRPTPNDTRILWDGRVFDIRPYVEIDRGQGLQIAVVARGE